MELSALSLLPSLLAIFLALYSKNVLVSLFGGIVLGLFILNGFDIVVSLEAIYNLFLSLLSELWILKTLAFAILVGSIMALIDKSGGIGGFVEFVQEKNSFINSARASLMLSYFIGVIIFVESSITALISGAVGKPLCAKYKVPSEKLAFVCDSTSAPISSLIVFNGWGALLLGLITAQITAGIIHLDAIELLIQAVFYNFYAMSALVVTFLFVLFNIDIGEMKRAKYTVPKIEQKAIKSTSASYMIVPLILMVGLVFVFLYLTGDGNMLKGSGSSSLFYTMVTTLLFTLIFFVGTKNMSFSTWSKTSLKGAKSLFSIAMILLFAFAIGKVTSELKTGLYLASLVTDNLSISLLASVIFLLSSIMAFATGTSWGTFSIMIPVAVPMAVAMDADVALCIGAVISGGVFGDHCSPISDTTIISSMASDCDVVQHVRTQLPYAIVSGIIAFCLFIVFSIKF